MLTIIFVLAVSVGVYFLAPYFCRKYVENKLALICAERRAIVLTYNDGPSASVTPLLLDLLKRHETRATFYTTGSNIEKNPGLLRRALEDGHVVGSRTYGKSNPWKTGPVTAVRDVNKGIQIVQHHGGDKYAFRTPYGKLTIIGFIHGTLRGLHFGWWSIDSKDSWARRPVQDVLDEIRRKNGGVVQMHDDDTYPRAPAHPPHADYVLELTAGIIQFARNNNYRIVPFHSLEW
jgi:peptidoglycan-N-acetylglucosamine deacetylase